MPPLDDRDQHYSVTRDKVTGQYEAECDCGWRRLYFVESTAVANALDHQAECDFGTDRNVVFGPWDEWGSDLES